MSVAEFTDFLESFYKHHTTKLAVIDELKKVSSEDLPNYVKAFFDTTFHVKNIASFTILAQMINDACHPKDLFKDTLITTVNNSILLLPAFEKIPTKQEQNMAIFLAGLIGDLYNIGWIKYERMESYMNKISVEGFANNFQLIALLTLLKKVELKLIRENRGAICKTYQRMLKEKHFIELHAHLMSMQAIEILEEIHELAAIKRKSVDFVLHLENLTDDSIDKIALEAHYFSKDDWFSFTKMFITCA